MRLPRRGEEHHLLIIVLLQGEEQLLVLFVEQTQTLLDIELELDDTPLVLFVEHLHTLLDIELVLVDTLLVLFELVLFELAFFNEQLHTPLGGEIELVDTLLVLFGEHLLTLHDIELVLGDDQFVMVGDVIELFLDGEAVLLVLLLVFQPHLLVHTQNIQNLLTHLLKRQGVIDGRGDGGGHDCCEASFLQHTIVGRGAIL